MITELLASQREPHVRQFMASAITGSPKQGPALHPSLRRTPFVGVTNKVACDGQSVA